MSCRSQIFGTSQLIPKNQFGVHTPNAFSAIEFQLEANERMFLGGLSNT
jgi:hypothetical protein